MLHRIDHQRPCRGRALRFVAAQRFERSQGFFALCRIVCLEPREGELKAITALVRRELNRPRPLRFRSREILLHLGEPARRGMERRLLFRRGRDLVQRLLRDSEIVGPQRRTHQCQSVVDRARA